MKPGVYNLELYRGDTYAWRFQLWEDTERTDPTDLTDVVVAAEIRDKSAGATITTLDCAVTLPNIIDATLTSTNSATVPKKGVWDLQLTFPGDVIRTVLKGSVVVEGDVTDSGVPVTSRRLRSA